MMKKEKQMIVFQSKNGAIELKTDTDKSTIWATQSQMASLFNVNSQAITKHLKNIYKEKELSHASTCSEMEQVQIEGNRKIVRKLKAYNLDAMISVGYRISSKTGTKFRQWATKTLRSHIFDGYTINPARISKNYDTFLKAVDEVKKLLPNGGDLSASDTLDLVKMFASTWLSLDAYDRASFPHKGLTKKQFEVTAEELAQALKDFKNDLLAKKEAGDLFGRERSRDAISGIVGNIFQSFAGQDVYITIEEKAAHLLYFVIKNHPFVDGNKRNGAFSFVWFLQRAKVLNTNQITPPALTALTLLIAESKPSDKERMIGLVLMLLRKN